MVGGLKSAISDMLIIVESIMEILGYQIVIVIVAVKFFQTFWNIWGFVSRIRIYSTFYTSK